MLSRKPLGVVGATMLGLMALLGTNAANAVIGLDGEDTGGVIYAQETITSSLEGRNGATYYVVNGGDSELDVTAELGFGTVIGASLIVRYDFTGMILTGMSNPVLTGIGTATLRQGGKAKDEHVVFLVTGINAAVVATEDLDLSLDEVAIAAGGGSISMHVRDDLSIPAETMASHSGAVTMASGLKPVKTQVNPTALVSEKFLAFEGTAGDTDTVTLGSVMVNLADMPQYRHAATGAPVADLDVLINEGPAGANMGDEGGSSTVFMGDFSFVTEAWLDTTVACATASPTDLLMDLDEDDMRDTTRLKSQSLMYLNDNPHLCIMVRAKDDAMAVAIPATPPYMVAKTIVLADGISSSKFPPAPAPAPLGAIMRNGTTVHIPYLTQFANYNQRIVIVNRGAEADYTFSFMTEDGVTATLGADAEGTLVANSTTYLSLLHGDLVTIAGTFNRASATLIVESEPSYIDVVVSQTNANGGTDTVKYTPND